jgi:hypothetical protein
MIIGVTLQLQYNDERVFAVSGNDRWCDREVDNRNQDMPSEMEVNWILIYTNLCLTGK